MAKRKQTRLTKAARGQVCTIELHPHCQYDQGTVVFCHAPSPDKGGSIKSPDWWGADGCAACHDIVDGRHQVKDIESAEIFECFVRGVYRTIKRRIEQGIISV